MMALTTSDVVDQAAAIRLRLTWRGSPPLRSPPSAGGSNGREEEEKERRAVGGS